MTDDKWVRVVITKSQVCSLYGEEIPPFSLCYALNHNDGSRKYISIYAVNSLVKQVNGWCGKYERNC